IRILILHPGLKDEPLKCSLKLERLGSMDTEYEALSYVWGSEVASDTIQLGSGPFYVTRNLLDALLELRQENEQKVLWVDALCINQCNMEERNGQVSVMHKIYESAKDVIAWLGAATADELRVLWPLARTEDNSPYFRGAEVSEELKSLVDREYWKRAWIVQEIAFARSV
ncbi:HET-domain-containing protein, partial [Lentithecium fluviatile CBS 122367]